MKIGIDLLWVRPNLCGGTESYIRNLLDGFGRFLPDNDYVLFLARDNVASFERFSEYGSMTLKICPTDCLNQTKRIIWENIHLHQVALRESIDLMFVPVYSKPLTFKGRIPYICVIHDLQAIHYPQYFSLMRRMFLKFMWWNACRTADWIITDSNYCRDDIISHYPWAVHKLQTVYIPITTKDGSGDWESIAKKFDLARGNYYYCVSSMLPHKNLITVLKAMAELKKCGSETKLVLSGVGGQNQEFTRALTELQIEDMVIETGFVSNDERDCLYENCKIFLFPSIFEGFGMPPVEAMRKGKNVVMTQMTCLKEVTEGKAYYVQEPLDVQEWIEKIRQAEKAEMKVERFEQYDIEHIVRQYKDIFLKFHKK